MITHSEVVTGDNVSALFTDWLIDDVIDCMESLGVPWAPVFGNHDGEGKADLLPIPLTPEISHELCNLLEL